MAKRVIFPIGQIIKGDFYGQYVYRWDDKSWGVCPGPKLEDSFWLGELYWQTADHSQSGNWHGPTNMDRISESTVDHYEEIGSQSTGPDAGAMLQGTLIGGIGLGLIAGAASTSATSHVAIYLKNGRSFVVRFSDTQDWIFLKSMLYAIEKPMTNKDKKSLPNSAHQAKQTSIPSSDSFEAIKKYKELLDLGIISQREFEKKKEALGFITQAELGDMKADTIDTSISQKQQYNYANSANESEAPLYCVTLSDCGPDKMRVMVQLHTILNMEIIEARSMVNSIPSTLIRDVSLKRASYIKEQLEEAGATIKVQIQLQQR